MIYRLKLLVSPFIVPIVLPRTILHITPFKGLGLWTTFYMELRCSTRLKRHISDGLWVSGVLRFWGSVCKVVPCMSISELSEMCFCVESLHQAPEIPSCSIQPPLICAKLASTMNIGLNELSAYSLRVKPKLSGLFSSDNPKPSRHASPEIQLWTLLVHNNS